MERLSAGWQRTIVCVHVDYIYMDGWLIIGYIAFVLRIWLYSPNQHVRWLYSPDKHNCWSIIGHIHVYNLDSTILHIYTQYKKGNQYTTVFLQELITSMYKYRSTYIHIIVF